MKEVILKKAGETFLKLGFKSVTMDDIANELAISKKTIYKYFKNKADLVNEATIFTHNQVHKEVLKIYNLNHNAIQENFEVKKVFNGFIQNVDDSPLFQLQKYYPETYKRITSQELCMFKDCLLSNIQKGINEGLYRKNILIDQVTKFYFSLVMSVHDSNLYTYNKNNIHKLELNILEYHTRAIATEKGIKILEEQLQQYNN
ncbi:TetR/AcrR family transcriptional regulator [Lutibacter holmesii]|uniref:TetR/AcrR family transcriptional regulator n=1 Tax=Lutibacter holmesii TaxID=1137985 RepID=A0ABW3WR89_9FLAO